MSLLVLGLIVSVQSKEASWRKESVHEHLPAQRPIAPWVTRVQALSSGVQLQKKRLGTPFLHSASSHIPVSGRGSFSVRRATVLNGLLAVVNLSLIQMKDTCKTTKDGKTDKVSTGLCLQYSCGKPALTQPVPRPLYTWVFAPGGWRTTHSERTRQFTVKGGIIAHNKVTGHSPRMGTQDSSQ